MSAARMWADPMRLAPPALAALLAVASAACGDDEASPAGSTGSTGSTGGGGASNCEPEQIPLDDGSCLDVGVSECPAGFGEIDDGGCAPLSWSDPVMECGAAPWGNIPVAPSTVYVDPSYSGGANDGSSTRPFTTIAQGLAGAPDGAIVALAAGSYAEAVIYPIDRRLVVWGRCPELVHVLGSGDPLYASVEMASTPAGVELHGVSVAGAGFGIAMSDALDVLIDHVVVAGTGAIAVSVDNVLGPASATLRHSSVHDVREAGLLVGGSEVVMEHSVIRDVLPAVSGLGAAVSAIERVGTASHASVRDTLLERLHGVGVGVLSSSLSLERSVIRDVVPLGPTGEDGGGIAIQGKPGGDESLWVSQSYIGQTHDVGIIAIDAQLSVSDTTIRDVRPQLQGNLGGTGISIQLSEGVTTEAAQLERVSIAQASGFGVLVSDAPATILSTWVTDTSPLASEELFGDGTVVVSFAQRADVTIDGSRFERSDRAGVSNFSSDVRVGRSMFLCNPIHLDGEDTSSGSFTFVDEGNDFCGCDGVEVVCKVTTANLAPPTPP